MTLLFYKLLLKHLLKNKLTSIINIFGLIIGLVSFILILLFIQNEYNYDKFNKNYLDIFRVEQIQYLSKKEKANAQVSFPIAKMLKDNFPEIQNITRIARANNIFIAFGNDKKLLRNGIYSDNSLFEVFSFPFVIGDLRNALSEPNSIILTESFAKQIFLNQNIIGENLLINNAFLFKVTGVVKDPPINSHFKFDFIFSFSSFEKINNCKLENNWNWTFIYTYLTLNKGSDYKKVDQKIKNVQNADLTDGVRISYYLKPLSKIHLYSQLPYELDSNGSIVIVYILCSIAILILLISSLNYINLTTANSISRMKEIGLKRVLGAPVSLLKMQFMFEALVITCISYFISIIIVKIFLPFFNQISGKELQFNIFENYGFTCFTLLIVVVVSIFSGLFPALQFSSVSPSVLLNKNDKKSKKNLFQNSLVIFQYFITTICIVASIVLFKQIKYLQEKEIGFDKHCVYYNKFINIDNDNIDKFITFLNELQCNPNISNSCISLEIPGEMYNNNLMTWEGTDQNEKLSCVFSYIDYDFINNYNIKLKQGRNFSKSILTDKKACIINETAVNLFGWKDPLGKKINSNYNIIGIVKDFHSKSLFYKMEPLVLFLLQPDKIYNNFYISFKINANDPKTIIYVEKEAKAFFKNEIIDIKYMEDTHDKYYIDIIKGVGNLISIFSILTIIIASLGLLCLVIFNLHGRKKEIVVRKINGASVGNIFLLLSKEIIYKAIFASITGCLVAYFIMKMILQQFVYATDLSLLVFTFAILIIIFISLITISYRIYKAAKEDVIVALKNE